MTATSGEPSLVIGIRGAGHEPTGAFRVVVSFGTASEYEVTVGDPADDAAQDLLAWYFEEHLRFPFLDKDLEQEAIAQIAAYGETLFGQVLGGAAHYDYRRLRDNGFDGCRIEISGTTGFHRLHWETLRDPEMPTPLAIRVPMARRVTGLGSRFDVPSGRPTLNVLVVTARPDGPGDVGYRTISRPLLDAVRSARLPVTVDLVRPGTWEALRDHLRAAREERGSGWYQIVHFDLHGAFEDYAALESGRQAERLLFGPAEMAPFEGRRGFVFFETGKTGTAQPVSAEEVADLLAEHRVPVAVLNACQSAMQDGSEAGLAQRLAEAGVPVAVGMAYSVTVSAAQRAMPMLYQRIAAGTELTKALLAARQELLDHPARQAYFGQQLNLVDWMLPVMFAQRPLHLGLRAMDDAEQATFYERAADVGEEPVPEYGFVGRDLDVQAIEHQLLAALDANVLVVQGMAGAGKSTLLRHLGWWWQRTGLVAGVFRFSYEDRAWTAGQIVREIRSKLVSPPEHARADAMSEAAQAEQVAGLLRATRHLVILDNTESITAALSAIPHALDQAEQQKLRNLIGRLRGGRTLVLLGSREAETWLSAGSTSIAAYPLPGLDPQAASLLIERILTRHHAPSYLDDNAERTALDELVTLLGAYPLPLTVVLPVLASTPPSAVLAELQAGGEAADPAGLIRQAVEYSHGKLDLALQDSLQLLAPFDSVIPVGPVLENYQDLLAQDEAVLRLGPVDLGAALERAITVGLAVIHPQLNYLAQVQPVLPWFLRSRLRAQPALQAATARAHYQHYAELAVKLWGMLMSPDNPRQRNAGRVAVRAEYANLTSALAYALRTAEPSLSLIGVLDEYLDQAQQHNTRRQLLDDAIAAYPKPADQSQHLELATLRNLAGHIALAQHRLDDASAHYQVELELKQKVGDRENLGGVYHQLGIVAHQQRRFAEAETSHRKALEIYLEFGERRGAGGAYHELGMIAQEQRQYAEAEARHRKALDIFLDLGDPYGTAVAYNELGIVAQEQERFAEAEASYRHSLDIKLKFGDRHGSASAYHQLGTAAQDQRRFAEAEASYRKALEIYLEFGDQHRSASVYSQLGAIALQQGRFAEAETIYRKAVDIFVEFGDQHSAARSYHQLGRVADEQRRFAEAEASYRKALEIYLEFGDQHSAADTFRQLGVTLARIDQHHEALAALLDAAVTFHQLTGHWDSQTLAWLHRENVHVNPGYLDASLRRVVPPELAEELAAAIREADDSPGIREAAPASDTESSPY